jgi:hypothetical protein
MQDLFGMGSGPKRSTPQSAAPPPSFYAPKSPYVGGGEARTNAAALAAQNETLITGPQGDTSTPFLGRKNLKSLLGD